MTYKESITGAMTWLGNQKKSVFLGEGLTNGGRVYGTLNNVLLKKCLEMPVAENLIMGAAGGLSLMGYRPIVVFQRMDFMLIAADQIINHISLIDKMSNGQYKMPVIIRAIIGSQKMSFDVGEQHKHDFRHIFEPYIKMVTLGDDDGDYAPHIYKWAYDLMQPILIVEHKDLYEEEIKKG